MSIENYNSYCIEHVLSFLSESDVFRFNEVYPNHEEAVRAHWVVRRVIRVDDILCRDEDVLLQSIKRCKNLKELKLTRRRSSECFLQLVATVARHCPMLEVLDIPGILLSKEDLRCLTSYGNLKTLNICYEQCAESIVLMGQLCENNPKLEILRIDYGCWNSALFHKFPQSIKKLKIYHPVKKEEIDALFDCLENCKPEEINLITSPLSLNQSMRLLKHTTLKSLTIQCETVVAEDIFENLFCNNQNLEYVAIDPCTFEGTCLRKLPKTIKLLQISVYKNFNYSVLLNFAKTWNIQSLELFYGSPNAPKFIPELVAAMPTSLQHLSLTRFFIDSESITPLQELKQLKSLHLSGISKNPLEDLPKIISSLTCLENLSLSFMDSHLKPELFKVIAGLPKLKEIVINHLPYPQIEDFNEYMRCLSRSQSLTSARILSCAGFSNEAALILIRGCKTLNRLLLDVYYKPLMRITVDLVPDTKAALLLQPNRTTVLNLTLKNTEFSSKDIPDGSSHHLLEVEFLNAWPSMQHYEFPNYLPLL